MNIIAITACPTGIAHTYMAKKALEDAAKSLGHKIKVETQGAAGIENKLSKTDVKEADILILAVGISISEKARFNDIRKVEIPVETAIKSASAVIKKIERKLKETKWKRF